MVTTEDQQLNARIHDFLDRKTQKFPELERIHSKYEPTTLFARVQDFASSLSRTSRPRRLHM